MDFPKQATGPTNKEELVLLFIYDKSNSEFLPNLSSLTAYLRALTQKNKTIIWKVIHQKEFENIQKKQFHEDILNPYFTPHKTKYLFVDTHHIRLGAILVQEMSIEDSDPVAIESRATSRIEQHYLQVDLEGMAVYFDLRRFHTIILSYVNSQMLLEFTAQMHKLKCANSQMFLVTALFHKSLF